MTTRTDRIETLFLQPAQGNTEICVTGNLISTGEISTNFYAIHSPNVDQQVSGTWEDIPYHTTVSINNDYSYTPGNGIVTINRTGTYELTSTTNITMATGSTRTTTSTRMQIDAGQGYILVPGSIVYSYHRNSSQGDNTLSCTCVRKCTAGDQIKVQSTLINTNGTKTLFLIPDECSLKIKRL